MFNVNHNKNNNFDNQHNGNITPQQSWFNIKNVQNKRDVSKHYVDICQRHHNKNKWILVINPEDGSLKPLSSSTLIDASKILCINANKVNVQMSDIETILSKGNCSAVILCNATFEQAQISHLTACAAKGQTECIVLKTMVLRNNMTMQ